MNAYFKARGIPESPDEDDALLDDCVQLADSARESFKRWRSSTESPAFDEQPEGPPLTAKQKYQKRLVNNRRSAAAARVYQEVLRREHTHALRKVVAEKVELKSAVETLQSTLDLLKEEKEQLVGTKEGVKEENVDDAICADLSGGEEDFGKPSGKLGRALAKEEAISENKDNAEDTLSNCDTGLDAGSSAAEKSDPDDVPEHEVPSCIARVGNVSLIPVANNVNNGEIVVAMASALAPVRSSQGAEISSEQENASGVNNASSAAACGTAVSGVGLLSSQLSLMDTSLLMSRCASGSSAEPVEDFQDSSQLLCSSQDLRCFSSQLFASQTA